MHETFGEGVGTSLPTLRWVCGVLGRMNTLVDGRVVATPILLMAGMQALAAMGLPDLS